MYSEALIFCCFILIVIRIARFGQKSSFSLSEPISDIVKTNIFGCPVLIGYFEDCVMQLANQ